MTNPGKSDTRVDPDQLLGVDAFQIAGWTIHPTTNLFRPRESSSSGM